jgi:ABC-type multidrug transport system fused ATPase/permease subunit
MSAADGVIFPLFSVFIAKILAIQIEFNPKDPDLSLSKVHVYSICGLVISFLGFLFVVAEKRFYNKIGLEVSSKLRQESFDKILKMDVAFFDKKEN